MDARDKLISEIADRECERLSRRVIRSLCGMTEGMQSGDDSGLKNLWDEVCVQVQVQESVMWDAYLDTIRALIADYLLRLDVALKQAIWLQTEEGVRWEPDEDDKEFPYCDDDIADYVLNEHVLVSATNWTNVRIEKYKEKSLEFG